MKLAIAVVVVPSRFNINVKSGNDSAINKAAMRIKVLTTHRFQLKSEKEHQLFRVKSGTPRFTQRVLIKKYPLQGCEHKTDLL